VPAFPLFEPGSGLVAMSGFPAIPWKSRKTEVPLKYFLSLLVVSVLAGEAYAKPRGNYTYSTPTVTSSYTMLSHGGDQERCQAEANYMAQHGIAGHVGSCIGRFEGVGYGSSPNCNTCTPSSPMNCTGDACAQGRNGMWYRVRSWR